MFVYGALCPTNKGRDAYIHDVTTTFISRHQIRLTDSFTIIRLTHSGKNRSIQRKLLTVCPVNRYRIHREVCRSQVTNPRLPILTVMVTGALATAPPTATRQMLIEQIVKK